MTETTPRPDNAGTDPHDRRTPDSMSHADQANGEGPDDGAPRDDQETDDPAVNGVQDGD